MNIPPPAEINVKMNKCIKLKSPEFNNAPKFSHSEKWKAKHQGHSDNSISNSPILPKLESLNLKSWKFLYLPNVKIGVK